ncbi:MAG: hypothetical protein AB8G14_02415 [Ilumatobacter sp.]
MSNVNNTPRSPRGIRRASIALAGTALVLAACGGSDAAEPAPAAEAPAQTPAETAAPAAPAIATPAATIGDTPLGEALVGERGLTLYGFTNDTEAASVCYGACADAWPPLIVDADWSVAPGLDAGIFNATVRDDGQLQLVAGKWPLYYFAGDATAGDINGQTSGDVWFVVGTDGVLIQDAPDAEAAPEEEAEEAVEEEAPAAAGPVVTAGSDLGDILVDADGLTLYGFTEDTDGNPTCNEACADAWPPVLVEDGNVPEGLDESVYSVVARDDGSNQLKAGKWPLYYFAGDGEAGDLNGQGSGDVWFAVTPEGGLVTGAASSLVATADSDLGEILVDAEGLTLYGFTEDTDGNPTCNDACADAWPALLVDGDTVPEGLDESVYSVVARDDGSNQLVAGKWPLYYFAGDGEAGDLNGQTSGDVWFVVTPEGGLIKDAPGAEAEEALDY